MKDDDIGYMEIMDEQERKLRHINVTLSAKDIMRIVGMICLTVIVVALILFAYLAGVMAGALVLIGIVSIIYAVAKSDS